MKIYHAMIVLIVLGAAGPPAAGAGQRLWVVSDGARLHADKTAASPAVARLPLEFPLTLVSADGKWRQVETTDGKVGWIYQGKVSDVKPGGDDADLDDLLGDLGESDILLAAADTSRSVRSSFMDQRRTDAAADIPAPYRYALDQVLSFYVTMAQLEAFLKEGGIGEYAP